MTHSHFLQMGGFRVRFAEGDKDSFTGRLLCCTDLDDGFWEGVLTANALKDLVGTEKLAFPDVSEDEIKDKSKGDEISKAVAALQIYWFYLQMIARTVYRLDMTVIEWTTFQLCVVCSSMYTHWGPKPFNVKCPIVLRPLGPDVVAGPESGKLDASGCRATCGAGSERQARGGEDGKMSGEGSMRENESWNLLSEEERGAWAGEGVEGGLESANGCQEETAPRFVEVSAYSGGSEEPMLTAPVGQHTEEVVRRTQQMEKRPPHRILLYFLPSDSSHLRITLPTLS